MPKLVPSELSHWVGLQTSKLGPGYLKDPLPIKISFIYHQKKKMPRLLLDKGQACWSFAVPSPPTPGSCPQLQAA